MKKSKKLLIALLSATCLTAGAFGLAACGSAQDDALYKIYTEYVADAGDNAKSYEEWLKDTLENVGKPGDKGEQGNPGADGKSAYDIYKDGLAATETPLSLEDWIKSLYGAQGEPGDDGISITGVSLSTDGKKLVFTFTKGDPVEITLPESVTHVHTYEDGYTALLIAPSGDSEGLAYKVCTGTGCGHIELVVVPNYSYKVSVYLSDFNGEKGTAAVGATVTLKDGETTVATATVDENGDAIFANSVEKGEYDIVVEKDGYVSYDKVLEVPEGYETATSETVSDYVAVLLTVPTEGDGSEDTPYLITSELNLEGYHFAASSGEDGAYFTFTAAKSGLYTFYTMQNNWLLYGYSQEKVFNIPLVEGDSVTLQNISTRAFDLCVECEEANEGSYQVPYIFEPAKAVSVTPADNKDDDYTYFVLNGAKGKYQFEFATGLELLYLGNNVDGNGTAVAANGVVDCSASGKHYFKAKTTAATIDFTATLYFLDGEKGKPIEATLNTPTTVTNDSFIVTVDLFGESRTVWYKVTLDAGKYVFENKVSTDVVFYLTENESVSVAAGKIYGFDVAAGTYLIKINQPKEWDSKLSKFVFADVTGSFTVKPYDATAHAGLMQSEPATLETEKAFVSGASNMYFVYTAPAAGFVSFNTSDNSYEVFSDASFKTAIVGTDIEVDEAGKKLYIRVNTEYAIAGDKITVAFLAADAQVTYKVTLTDDSADNVSGLTVKLMKGGEVAGSTTTVDGVAEFTLTAGTYTIVIEFGEEPVYGYQANYDPEKPFTVEAHNNEINIDLLKYQTYTFNVSLDTGVSLTPEQLENIRLIVSEPVNMGYRRVKTFTYAELTGGSNTWKALTMSYQVELTGLPENYEFATNANRVMDYASGEYYYVTAYSPAAEAEGAQYIYTFTVKEKSATPPETQYDEITLTDNSWSSLWQNEKAIKVAVSGSDMANITVSLSSGWYACIDTLIFVDYNGTEYQLIENGKATNIAQNTYSSKIDINYDSEHGKAVSATVKDLYGAADGYPAEYLKVVFKGDTASTADTANVTQN